MVFVFLSVYDGFIISDINLQKGRTDCSLGPVCRRLNITSCLPPQQRTYKHDNANDITTDIKR